MIKSFTALALVGLFAFSAPALADHRGCSRTDSGGILGALGGAALGGFLGSQVGSGSGQLAATGAGVFLGGVLGNEIGHRMTCEDQAMYHTTTQHTLETQPSGTAVAWRNPENGNYGTVTPTRTYQQPANGQYCREFQQTISVGGEAQEGYGTACRQPDGSWQIVQ